MKKVIVTTTIHPPTEAIRRFASMDDWDLVVVGDVKTPADYRLPHGLYMTPPMQEELDAELSEAIGWNCIQRRNFGLLQAARMGADVVAVVDDDNIPFDAWGKDLMIGRPAEANYFLTDLPVFDPVGATNYGKLWHRGYPLQLLSQRDYSRKERRTVVADVQADFWDGNPDIDAICRMEHAPDCRFDAAHFPIASNAWSPFDSQNTFLKASWLKHYFLFPGIGRMDDIWSSYYVQAMGAKVVYGRPSVRQERNVHDLTRDMEDEFLGYQLNLKLICDLKTDPSRILSYLPQRSQKAFELYRRHFACR